MRTGIVVLSLFTFTSLWVACASSAPAASPNTPSTSNAQVTREMTWEERDLNEFFYEVLVSLGISGSNDQFSIDAMRAWATMENTKAQWNPLATTLNVPGSSDFNSAGVQNYPDFGSGSEATANTLSLSYYGGIRAMLKGEEFDRSKIEQGLKTWSGSGPYVSNLLDEWETLWSNRSTAMSQQPALQDQGVTQSEPSIIWSLTSGQSDWNGTYGGPNTIQPVLTVNGQEYRYSTMEEYLDHLHDLKSQGAVGLDADIKQYGDVIGQIHQYQANLAQTSRGYDLAPDYSAPPQSPLSAAVQAQYKDHVQLIHAVNYTPGWYSKAVTNRSIRPLLASFVNSAYALQRNLESAGYFYRVYQSESTSEFLYIPTNVQEEGKLVYVTVELYAKPIGQGNHMYSLVETITVTFANLHGLTPTPIHLQCHKVACSSGAPPEVPPGNLIVWELEGEAWFPYPPDNPITLSYNGKEWGATYQGVWTPADQLPKVPYHGGEWSTRPILTVDGVEYSYDTPEGYIAHLQRLKNEGVDAEDMDTLIREHRELIDLPPLNPAQKYGCCYFSPSGRSY